MKKILFIAACFAATIATTHAQDAATNSRLNEVLQSYFLIKDALVAGNGAAAAQGATSFIKNLNGISYTVISEGNVNTLLTDAGGIAGTKDVDRQRTAFANFSNNMAVLIKALKFVPNQVYIQYCPMKNASWLSLELAIKNPYYGSSMLSCGKVTETIE